jgi:hypothetical protein
MQKARSGAISGADGLARVCASWTDIDFITYSSGYNDLFLPKTASIAHYLIVIRPGFSSVAGDSGLIRTRLPGASGLKRGAIRHDHCFHA